MLNYEELYKERVKENIQVLRDNINDKSVSLKIKKWAEKYELHPKYVKYKVAMDDVFALNFIKEPSRQNFHEDAAAYEIMKWNIVEEFKKLDKGGDNSKVIDNGEVISLKDITTSKLITKTIDFQWDIVNQTTGEVFICYASHKYTKDSGGAQDNQYNDIKIFMEHAKENKNRNELFFAICDGKYYQIKQKISDKTKLELLNEYYQIENKLIALTINDLYKYLYKISIGNVEI